MQYTRKLSVVSLAVIFLLALTVSVAFAQDPTNGQTLWLDASCKNCHGEAGEGIFGSSLAGRGPDNAENPLTAEEWIAQVRSPRNRMPTYSATQVSDEALTDMHAYMASLEVPAEFGFQQIELPEGAHPGQQLIIEKRCVGCHGETGPGGYARRGEVPTLEVILTQVRTPRNNMPSFREDQISDAEVQQIVDYLATQVTPASLPPTGAETPAASTAFIVMWLSVMAGLLLAISGIALRWHIARH